MVRYECSIIISDNVYPMWLNNVEVYSCLLTECCLEEVQQYVRHQCLI